MYVAHAAVALFLVSAMPVHAESSMALPGSPPCKAVSSVRASDVREWTDFVDTQVPPLSHFQKSNASLGKTLAGLQSQEQRSHFITATYVRLCWDRVLDKGRCSRAPDPAFFWSCAAASGSSNAGTYMRSGISEYKTQTKSGTHPIEWLMASKGVAPAVKTLGDANALIFDTVAWQHFAAAKCGADYAIALLGFSSVPERAQYQAYWRSSKTATPLDGSAVPRPTNQLLGIEQRLIQPLLEKQKSLLGIVSQKNFIRSGVSGTPSFFNFSTKTLGTPKSRVNFADFAQRFVWERDTLVPAILSRTLAPSCGGAQRLQTLAAITGDRQSGVYQQVGGLSGFPRLTTSELNPSQLSLHADTTGASGTH